MNHHPPASLQSAPPALGEPAPPAPACAPRTLAAVPQQLPQPKLHSMGHACEVRFYALSVKNLVCVSAANATQVGRCTAGRGCIAGQAYLARRVQGAGARGVSEPLLLPLLLPCTHALACAPLFQPCATQGPHLIPTVVQNVLYSSPISPTPDHIFVQRVVGAFICCCSCSAPRPSRCTL